MSPAPALPASSMRGLVAMIVAMGCFITNDTLLKIAATDFPVGEVLTLRSTFAAVLLLGLIAWKGDLRVVPLALNKRIFARSGLDALTTFSYVIGLTVLPIASSTTIYMAAPLITTALSVPLLGEKVGTKRWCAIVVGFAGAILVTRPDPSTFNAMAILPLLAAFFGSVRDLTTRGINPAVPGSVVALASAVLLGFVGLTFAAWEPWTAPSPKMLALVLGAGAAFAVGNLLLIYAFRTAPVAAISPLRYVLVPGALFSGMVIFGDIPDAWANAGTILVVGAGLYSIQNEARRGQAQRRAAKAAVETQRAYAGGAPLAGAVTRAPPND